MNQLVKNVMIEKMISKPCAVVRSSTYPELLLKKILGTHTEVMTVRRHSFTSNGQGPFTNLSPECQLERGIQWCFNHRDTLPGHKYVVESLHAKAIVLGLETDEDTVHKLASIYSGVPFDATVRKFLSLHCPEMMAKRHFYAFSGQGPLTYLTRRDQLMDMIHYCFENLTAIRSDMPIHHKQMVVTSLHAKTIVLGLDSNDVFVGMMMSLYTRVSGFFECSCDIFAQHEHKGITSWNNYLFTLADSEPEKAITAFVEFEKTGIRPQSRTFRALLTAHSRCNTPMEEVYFVVKKMKDVYGFEPDVRLYGCVIDKLAKSKSVEMAIELVAQLECKVSDTICGMIFGRCMRDGDVASAKMMLDVLVRKGGDYKVESRIYIELQKAGLEWHKCVTPGKPGCGISHLR